MNFQFIYNNLFYLALEKQLFIRLNRIFANPDENLIMFSFLLAAS